ncbi:hypothetical protein EVAR_35308_1 [Eumeta japonica]|uniref:Uncharacterized protein n=1 Tax=Eumeta variegata TaxID=151549 RepID=A0A4C1XJ14_EUMVA|nr:hypothetical protein EVAR_35308_1 [Eumeta japonica]
MRCGVNVRNDVPARPPRSEAGGTILSNPGVQRTVYYHAQRLKPAIDIVTMDISADGPTAESDVKLSKSVECGDGERHRANVTNPRTGDNHPSNSTRR